MQSFAIHKIFEYLDHSIKINMAFIHFITEALGLVF